VKWGENTHRQPKKGTPRKRKGRGKLGRKGKRIANKRRRGKDLWAEGKTEDGHPKERKVKRTLPMTEGKVRKESSTSKSESKKNQARWGKGERLWIKQGKKRFSSKQSHLGKVGVQPLVVQGKETGKIGESIPRKKKKKKRVFRGSSQKGNSAIRKSRNKKGLFERGKKGPQKNKNQG